MAEPVTNVLGVVAIKHCGEYDATRNYEKLNVVTYNGSSYCAKMSTTGNLPTNTNFWDLMAEKGDKGDKGDTGDDGYTPVKGTDYYTAEDKAELEATLSSDVTTEVTSQLGSLTSATPLVASSLSGMTDTSRIYVLTTDGHWYWYDGSNWIDGGVYQSSGISDSSISFLALNDDLKNIFKEDYSLNNSLFYKNFPSVLTNDVTWIDDKALNNNGVESTVTGYSIAYFDVIPGSLIISSKNTASYGWAKGFVFYNNDTFIGYKSENLVNGLLTIPNNCNKLGITVTSANKDIVLALFKKQVQDIYLKENSIDINSFITPLKNSITPSLDKTNCTLLTNKYLDDEFAEHSLTGLNTVIFESVSYDDFFLLKGNGFNRTTDTIKFFDSNNNLLYKSGYILSFDFIFKLPTEIQNISKMVVTFFRNPIDYGKIESFYFLDKNDLYDRTIICAGDSLTAGANGADNAYVDYLRTFYSNSVVENRGHSGWTAAGLLPELCNMADKQNYYGAPSTQTDYTNIRAVIINMGSNGGVHGSIETSIPQIANATDLSGNSLSFMTVENAIAEGGFKYNNEVIDTVEKYWNLFADNWYGNVALTIEYIQWQNPKTQIFLLPPCISTISASSSNSAETIGNAMKELCELYGINFIDINNSIGINRRNAAKYCVDYIHGTNQRNEMVGKYVARYISNKIYN